ncbi:MAG TPA: tetratricopeptide repeat protein [Candidatus Sulfotelmatobacter sp.]|nr:tetratricopeptide repeat protein [Candidatus Sulfotelmatobacter sp.]
MDSPVLLPVFAQEADTSASLWPEAKAAMEKGNFAEARRLLQQAIKEHPRDGALWFHLGVSCTEINEVDDAIAAFEHARVLAPRQPDTYFNLGLVYWKKGNLNKAKEAYREGLALRPNETSALQNYSLLLMKTGEYKAALTPLQQLKKDPTLGISSRAALIECYLKAGEPSGAEHESDEIIAEKAVGALDQTKIAAVLVANGAPELAEKMLRHSLSIDPNQANASDSLGEIYMKQRKFPEAAECFQKAMELDPASPDYAFAMVRALLALKQPKQLIAFLKSVEGRFAALPNFQYALGLAYYNEHHYAESAEILEKLLLSNPPRADKVEHVLGDSYLSMGKLPEAEKAYRKAIEENPKDPEYYVAYATAVRREGTDKLDDAIVRLKSAQGMNPADWRIQLELGLCYESKEQFTDAAALIEQAVQSEPELTAGHVALARIYFRLGRKADGDREKKIVADLEKKQQQKLVREFSTDSLIEGAPPETGGPTH